MNENNNGAQRSAIAVEEGFVVDVQSYLQELMNGAGITRAELARRMGVSRARITQIFSDDCTNLTIRLLAKAAHAMGEVPSIESDLTRGLKKVREDEERTALIRHSGNVVPIWEDSESTNPADFECVGSDARLDGIVQRLRAAGGAR